MPKRRWERTDHASYSSLGSNEGRKAYTRRVHKRSVMHHLRRFGGCDAPLAHDAFGLCALRKRVRVSALAESHRRFIDPVHSPQMVRQSSTLRRGQCGERPIEDRVVGTGRSQRFAPPRIESGVGSSPRMAGEGRHPGKPIGKTDCGQRGIDRRCWKYRLRPEGAQENPLDTAWPEHASFREHIDPVHADRQFRQIPVVFGDLFLPGLGPVIALAHDRTVVIR